MDGLAIENNENIWKTMILKNVKIDKIIFKGLGLGEYEGKKVFVPYAYPNDVVNVSVISEKKDYYKAKIIKLVESGIERQKVTCPSFLKCGGCTWLDAKYADQLIFNKDIIVDIFNKHVDKIEQCRPSMKFYGYRNKVFFPFTSDNEKVTFGLFKALSHDVVSADHCKLVTPKIIEIAKVVCEYLTRAKVKVFNEKTQKGNLRHLGFRINKKGEILIILVTRNRKLAFTNQLVRTMNEDYPNVIGIIQNINSSNSNRIMGEDDKILYGQDFFYEFIGDLKYKIHYQSFFQINRDQTENIYNQIIKDVKSNSIVLDAYSGVSTIGLYIAQKASQVISVENNEWACKDALENTKLNNVTNLKVINSDVETIFNQLLTKVNIDTIVFDPPRKGLDSSIRDLIKGSTITKILYLSCNATTQKRDVDDLLKAGYEIKKIIPFDMFPNTYHIENYIVLERNPNYCG